MAVATCRFCGRPIDVLDDIAYGRINANGKATCMFCYDRIIGEKPRVLARVQREIATEEPDATLRAIEPDGRLDKGES